MAGNPDALRRYHERKRIEQAAAVKARRDRLDAAAQKLREMIPGLPVSGGHFAYGQLVIDLDEVEAWIAEREQVVQRRLDALGDDDA